MTRNAFLNLQIRIEIFTNVTCRPRQYYRCSIKVYNESSLAFLSLAVSDLLTVENGRFGTFSNLTMFERNLDLQGVE